MQTSSDGSLRLIPKHSPTQPRHGVSERFENFHEEKVLLEAVATAPALDQFSLKTAVFSSTWRCRKGSSLEGNRLRMQAVDKLERIKCSYRRTSVTYTLKVRIKIEIGHQRHPVVGKSLGCASEYPMKH